MRRLLLPALALLTAAVVAVALVAAGREPAVRQNKDVMFLQMMVVHHAQGIAITALVDGRDVRTEISMIAAAIRVTQADEIDRMSGWLRARGQPASADPGAHAAHGGLPGTTEQELQEVEGRTGADFERAWINLLVAHQDDAVQLARQELAGGTDPPIREFAGRVDRSRTAQLKQLTAMLT